MTDESLAYDLIFIIDDNKIINLTHLQIIMSTGIAGEIKVFSDPLKALMELSYELKFSNKSIMVLLDIQMDEINGFDFLESIVPIKKKSYLNVVMVTASSDYRNRKKSLEHPLVNGYFTKPLSKKQVLDFVQDHSLKSNN